MYLAEQWIVLVRVLLVAAVLFEGRLGHTSETDLLAGTLPLEMQGDISSQMVDGVERFLQNQLDSSVEGRKKYWHRDLSSWEAYGKSIEPNRKELARILGVCNDRVPFREPEILSTTSQPALIANGPNYQVFAIRWPVLGQIHGEGLLLMPTGRNPIANVVALPDCNQTSEQLVGLVPGVPAEAQYPRFLAEAGCQVVVPMLIDRQERFEHLSNREWLYRPAYELGRGLIGYELQKVFACVDWFSKSQEKNVKIGVFGWGEGGLLALYAGALDPRISVVAVSGYFDKRNQLYREPIDRNVFGLLEQFGDAELAAMVVPRTLIIEAARGPEANILGGRGAPAQIVTPQLKDVVNEAQRARKLFSGLQPPARIEVVVSGASGNSQACTTECLSKFLTALNYNAHLPSTISKVELVGTLSDAIARHQSQVEEIDQYNQQLLRHSPDERQRFFWDKLNFDSPAQYAASVEPLRKVFYDEIIGRFDLPLMPPNVRTRRIEENEKWTRYEVVLDVFPDVIAYGLLTIPANMKQGERRPLIVCQHGLEGRPQDTIGQTNYDLYKAFSTNLAEQGFITFAPQNLYVFGDRFRTLQRMANPIKKSLFSIIVPQHQQIVQWLQTLPVVDPNRIAFYGLSYGGKTAMRVPPLVPGYCLSICSGDFNDWIDKTASTHNPYAYPDKTEYEMFEFNLGNTFNYAEMAALIAPRPFMVERGHFDGVAADETVASEYAKVRRLYEAQLHLPDQTAIEWFVGPHTINGQGTYAFLHQHLHWPR